MSIRSGYRPLQPVARGSAKPLPDFLVSLPPPDRNLAGEAPRDDRVRSRSPVPKPPPDAASSAGSDSGLSADSSDSDATAASDSDLESAPRSKAKQPPASRSVRFMMISGPSC